MTTRNPWMPGPVRIYAGDFLKKQELRRLDILLLTHFRRESCRWPGPGATVRGCRPAADVLHPSEGGGKRNQTENNGLQRRPGIFCVAWIFCAAAEMV